MKRLVSVILVVALLCTACIGYADNQTRIDTVEIVKTYYLTMMEAFLTLQEEYPSEITDDLAELMYLYYKAYNTSKDIVKSELAYAGKGMKSILSMMGTDLEDMYYTQEKDILEMHHKWKIGEITRNEFVEYISIYIRSVIKANKRTNE